MIVQLTRDMHSNIQSTARHDGHVWRYAIQAQGAGDVKPADVAAQVVDRIAKEVVGVAEAAKAPKGMPSQGMQQLRLIRDADKDIERARIALEQAQARMAQIQQERSTALRDTPEGDILDRVAAIDAKALRTSAVVDQLAQDLRAKQQARSSMLPSFRQDRDVSVGTCLRKEKEAAQHAQAEAYAALEKAMGPHLLAIAQAQAKLMALEAQATFPAIQARLDAEEFGITPPAPTILPAIAPSLSAPPATTRPRHSQELVTTNGAG